MSGFCYFPSGGCARLLRAPGAVREKGRGDKFLFHATTVSFPSVPPSVTMFHFLELILDSISITSV